MTLTTHALVGASVAQLFPAHPYVAFFAGFASHFAIDSLPHWDYLPQSLHKDTGNPLDTDMKIGKEFFRDLVVIGGDALFGVLLAILLFSVMVFHTPLPIIFIGAVAGILPDGLQFVYFKTRSAILEPLQRFHIWVQKGKSIYPPAWVGMSYQLLLVLLIISVEKVI